MVLNRSIVLICSLSTILVACNANPNATTPKQTETPFQLIVTETPTPTVVPTKPEPIARQVDVEQIRFQSDDFTLVGDLQIPDVGGKHPAIIMLHGDGGIDRYDSGKYRPIMTRFLRAGYAVFSWDKPGTGESTGELAHDSEVLSQRVSILVNAIDLIKEHPSIDHERIGVWGISQAGYVMPLALTMTNDITFMIVISGPAMDSYDQGAYIVSQIAFCAGVSQEEADVIAQYISAAEKATTYQEYHENMTLLLEHPHFSTLGISLTIRSESQWEPEDRNRLSFFNPIEGIKQAAIPILAIFGEKDRQVDPFQGEQAYHEALLSKGIQESQVVLVPDADHNIVLSATGCLDERANRPASEWLKYAPGYLDTMEAWLIRLYDPLGD